LVGSVVTFLDITERRKLEDQFRRAQQRLRDVVASSPAVLFTLAVTENQVQSITGPATTCGRFGGIRRKSPSARTGGQPRSTRRTGRGSRRRPTPTYSPAATARKSTASGTGTAAIVGLGARCG
jgi:hypothetical protein